MKTRNLSVVGSTSLIALSALAGTAIAQETVEEEVSVQETVVVTGVKLANRNAIAAKRDTAQIADFLSADDVGQLPDFNIADSLRRAPGVFTVFDEDEGRFVSIRGLRPEFTFATIDGTALPGMEIGSRETSFEVMPSTSIKRLEVFKTLTADLDGNAIGGVVNAVTRSAFDADGLYVNVQGLLGTFSFDDVPRADRDNGISYRVDGTISNTFGANDEFGALLSVNLGRKDRDQLNYRPQGRYTDIGGQSLSNGMRYNTYDLQDDRLGVLGKLEFQPNEDLYLFVRGYYFEQDYDEQRFEVRVEPRGVETSPSAGVYANTIGRVRSNVFQFPIVRENSGIQLGGEYLIGEDQKIEFSASLNKSDRAEDQPLVQFRDQADGFSYTTQIGGNGIPVLNFDDPAFYLNTDNYPLNAVSNTMIRTQNDINEYSLDYTKNFDVDSEGWGFKAGLNFRTLEYTNVFNGMDYAFQGGAITGLGVTLTDFVQTGTYQPPSTAFPLLSPNSTAFFAALAANPDVTSTFVAGVPDSVNEDILAAYGLATYASGPFRVIGGLRFEETSGVEGFDDYSDVLPSVAVSYDFSDNVRVRGAYSKALGRPDYGSLLSSDTINTGSETITVFNSDLQARRSDNFDASLEVYFDEGDSLFSVGVFHKEIDDEIFTRTSTRVIDGTEFDVNLPTNAESSSLTGVEFNLVKNNFEFLPEPLEGFGASVNVTFTDGEFSDGTRTFDGLVGQPDMLLNASLLYANGPFEGRLAWNRTSELLNRATSSPDSDRLWEEFDQLDLQMRYRLNNNFTLIAEGRNLTDEDRSESFRNGNLYEIQRYGNSYFFGLNYRY